MLLVLKISKTWLVLKNSNFKIAKNHLVNNKKTLGPIYLFSVYLLLPLHTQGVVWVINVSTHLGPLWEDLMPHGSLSRLLYRQDQVCLGLSTQPLLLSPCVTRSHPIGTFHIAHKPNPQRPQPNLKVESIWN